MNVSPFICLHITIEGQILTSRIKYVFQCELLPLFFNIDRSLIWYTNCFNCPFWDLPIHWHLMYDIYRKLSNHTNCIIRILSSTTAVDRIVRDEGSIIFRLYAVLDNILIMQFVWFDNFLWDADESGDPKTDNWSN